VVVGENYYEDSIELYGQHIGNRAKYTEPIKIRCDECGRLYFKGNEKIHLQTHEVKIEIKIDGKLITDGSMNIEKNSKIEIENKGNCVICTKVNGKIRKIEPKSIVEISSRDEITLIEKDEYIYKLIFRKVPDLIETVKEIERIIAESKDVEGDITRKYEGESLHPKRQFLEGLLDYITAKKNNKEKYFEVAYYKLKPFLETNALAGLVTNNIENKLRWKRSELGKNELGEKTIKYFDIGA